jgi:outer membrane receptor protein involved in Fe transport
MKAALRSATCLSLVAFSSTAVLAQDAADSAAAEEEASADTIIVTGSRIARPDLKSTVPVIALSGETFVNQGHSNIGDSLNDLPQLRATRGQQNPNLGVGISGLNLLDLRGLGTARTLVLVNGRRHVGADILSNAVSVDTNTIPANLVERVDVVTGGNSSVYGSDAIAGVVNFVLKRNFEGLEAHAKAGVSTPGGYGFNYNIDAVWGKNFADGRGNITLSAEYKHQNRVYASDAPWARQVDGFYTSDLDPAGLVNGSDGVFDRAYGLDFRQSSIHVNGLVPITQPSVGAGCGIGLSNGVVPGTPFNCTYIFQNDGSLAAQTGGRIGTGVIGSIIGGNGQTGREGVLFTALPKQDNYNFNMLGHFEVSDALDLFWEAKYTRIVSFGGNAGTAAIQGTFAQFDLRERVRLDNPYLSAAARTTITNAITSSGCNTSFTTSCNIAGVPASLTRTTFGTAGLGDGVQGIGGPLNADDLAKIAAGTYRFVVGRNLSDLGARDERFLRQTYRAVVGARGTFNTDWKYEIAFNYGRFTEDTNASGYVDKQRFMLALDAGRNPVTGNIECRAKFDATARIAFPSSAANTARLAADVAACVPYNPFGQGNNAASIAYFGVNYGNKSKMSQTDISGFVAGNTGGFLNLPGGPIDFVIGGEYRREAAEYRQDDFGASGNTNAVAFGNFLPPPFKVTEAFGEIRIPLFKNKPFLEELTLTGAGRVSDYNSGAGTVWTWNAGGDWSPTPGLRFRANYSRAVRAPNLSETFGPLVPNFAPGFVDPCASNRIGSGTQFRGANCTSDLGALLQNVTTNAYSLPILSGVNPDLQAEKSKSLTIGMVAQPKFIPGLNIAVDYYNITVNGVIVALTAQAIANSCYDQPTLNNPFCGLFTRVRSGTGPFGEVPGNIQGNTLVSAPFNFAKRVRRGIDFQLDYSRNLGNDFSIKANLIYTHSFQISNYENPALPDFENRILGELGDPSNEFRLGVDVTKGPFTFGYEVRYIGPMWINAYEDYNALQDRVPQDSDYAEISQYPSVFYHDVRFEWDMEKSGIAKNFMLYAGVDNVFNLTPPLGTTGTGERVAGGGTGSPIYSVRGRQIYAGLRAKF